MSRSAIDTRSITITGAILVVAIAVLGSCAQSETEPPARPDAVVYEEPDVDDTLARMRPATWSDSAPGEQLMPGKLLPISRVPYSPVRAMQNPVADEDLVIGLEIDGEAVAWPIKMLGGPKREIVNHRIGGVDLAANW